MTGGELYGEGWKQFLSVPLADNPFIGGCRTFGRKDGVLVPAIGPDGTSTCTATKHTPLAIFFGSACSNVEPAPFYGADEADQRACAVAANQAVETMRITVDGGDSVDIHRPRFEVFSPQMTVQLPADNTLGVDPQTATFTAVAWGAVIRKLSPGQHTIILAIQAYGESFSYTVFLNVV